MEGLTLEQLWIPILATAIVYGRFATWFLPESEGPPRTSATPPSMSVPLIVVGGLALMWVGLAHLVRPSPASAVALGLILLQLASCLGLLILRERTGMVGVRSHAHAEAAHPEAVGQRVRNHEGGVPLGTLSKDRLN